MTIFIQYETENERMVNKPKLYFEMIYDGLEGWVPKNILFGYGIT